MLTRARLCRVTGSRSSSFRGGSERSESRAPAMSLRMNSMALLRLNAWTSAVSWSVCEFGTWRTSSPCSMAVTGNSGCSTMARSTILFTHCEASLYARMRKWQSAMLYAVIELKPESCIPALNFASASS
eukprot:Amastigsp_a677959_13.p4 type:complete len:129 gc:universal Amastigsp_a677959_13:1036-650(-)